MRFTWFAFIPGRYQWAPKFVRYNNGVAVRLVRGVLCWDFSKPKQLVE